MSKNTSSNAFRRIDVDQFNEDNFKDEEPVSSPTTGSPGVSESEIGNLLSKNQLAEALVACLNNFGTTGVKNQAEKDSSSALVTRVLMSIKQNQVDGIIAQLDNDQKDLLMKYIYRGFETPSEGSSAHLLVWHEKVFESTGVGSIVRVLADRKKV